MSGKRRQHGKWSWYRHLSSFLAVLVVAFVFPVVQALGLELPQTLIEQAGTPLFFSGQPIQVQAMITDPVGILAVRCYFRYGQDADFVFVSMEQEANGQYQGVLPSPGSSVQEVEYLYLVVNARRQVVRTPLYTLSDPGTGWFSVAEEGTKNIRVQTDLAVPTGPDSLIFDSNQVKVSTVAAAERYGLVAGLYNNSLKDAAGKVARGYFGGFELQPDGRYRPVEGIVDLRSDAVVTGLESVTGEGTVSTEEEPLPTEIIGPDIAGDTWEGICYLGWGESYGTGTLFVSYATPITAIVTHEGNQVTITLSTECVIFNGVIAENVGQHFQGSIDWAGNMLLLDQRDPVQTWSTHWGPATATDILIGDYVTPFDPEENPYPDYYVIELTRELPPPPPPPPPEPDPIIFLPAVYRLLLH